LSLIAAAAVAAGQHAHRFEVSSKAVLHPAAAAAVSQTPLVLAQL